MPLNKEVRAGTIDCLLLFYFVYKDLSYIQVILNKSLFVWGEGVLGGGGGGGKEGGGYLLLLFFLSQLAMV